MSRNWCSADLHVVTLLNPSNSVGRGKSAVSKVFCNVKNPQEVGKWNICQRQKSFKLELTIKVLLSVCSLTCLSDLPPNKLNNQHESCYIQAMETGGKMQSDRFYTNKDAVVIILLLILKHLLYVYVDDNFVKLSCFHCSEMCDSHPKI